MTRRSQLFLRNDFVRLGELRRMTTSEDRNARLSALFLMRKQIGQGTLRRGYFDLARGLIDDEDNDCRWQAMIVIGEFIEDEPESVWEVLKEYGEHEDDDMRTAVGTVLLEHFIEHHRKRYLPRAKRLARRSKRFAEALNMCWDFTRPFPTLEEVLRGAPRW